MELPVTERIHQQELSLPISPAMSDDDAQRVAEAVNAFCQQSEKSAGATA